MVAIFAVLAMVSTVFLTTSCSKDDTDTFVDSFILTNPWRCDGLESDQDRHWKYLRLTNEHQFELIEVENGTKHITTGEWEVSNSGKTFTLNAKAGALSGQSLVMNMLETSFTHIKFTVNGVEREMVGCKTKDIEEYKSSTITPYNYQALYGTWENTYKINILRYLQINPDRTFTFVEQPNDTTQNVSKGKWTTMNEGYCFWFEFTSSDVHKEPLQVMINEQPNDGMLKLGWYYPGTGMTYDYELYKVDNTSIE